MKKSYPVKNQKGAKLKTEKSKIRKKLQILLFMVSNKQSKKKPNLKKIRAEMECDLECDLEAKNRFLW